MRRSSADRDRLGTDATPSLWGNGPSGSDIDTEIEIGTRCLFAGCWPVVTCHARLIGTSGHAGRPGVVVFLAGRWHGVAYWSAPGARPDDPRLGLLAAGHEVVSVALAPSLLAPSVAVDFGLAAAVSSVEAVLRSVACREPALVIGYSQGAALALLARTGALSGIVLLDGGVLAREAPSRAREGHDGRGHEACGTLVRNPAIDFLADQPGRFAGLGPAPDADVACFLRTACEWWPGRMVDELNRAARSGTRRQLWALERLRRHRTPMLGVMSGRESLADNRIVRSWRRTRSPDLTLLRLPCARHAEIVAGSLAREIVTPAVLAWVTALRNSADDPAPGARPSASRGPWRSPSRCSSHPPPTVSAGARGVVETVHHVR